MDNIAECIDNYIGQLKESLEELNDTYRYCSKYVCDSNFRPVVSHLAGNQFERRNESYFYFVSEDRLKESMARGNTNPLLYYPAYFEKEFSRIMHDSCTSQVEKSFLMSVLLHNLFEAIDDIRLWGNAYADATGQITVNRTSYICSDDKEDEYESRWKALSTVLKIWENE